MIYVFYCLSIFLIISVLVPFIKSDHWTVRVFDYPRFQKLVLIFISFTIWLFIEDKTIYDDIILGLLGICTIYLAWVIIPYTPLGKKMIDQVELKENELPFNLLVANVYQENDHYQKLVDLINKTNPDIVFLLETNKAWMENIREATNQFEYKIEVPLENTYGLLFYSKLPIEYQEVNYLISTEIPSIIVDIKYKNQTIRLYGLHPTPPVPQENEESTERDAEILMIGKAAKDYGKACIVFGDMNDVAWSRTTRLFLKTSQMLDPRRGRGMYNTFHVKHWFLRWPLDHYFLSSQFRLIDMKIEDSIDSDHFPISISVVLRNDDTSGEMKLDTEEKQELKEKIEDGIEKGDAN
ncbi:endonuclease/exonuclease/phosphatase family protein [Faecalibacter macacae]|uniref:Endonuclease/exonuclease/phosphatase family protein n=1 Tax=Faecalibacter macacae TaxID=1859289 RepID=A0A3L9MGD9_9FLAO|nr:endonuclease/exonuclease/phosphatase family protein [Faecalibacter macacae]RLZ11968.1 endonuclease/exonuclease/phosphatase family protein [Faecalibacter macacae]